MIITIGVNSGGIIGDDLEYFDLYSNDDEVPFQEDVTKSELLNGLQVIAPNGTTQIKIKSKDSPCDVSIILEVDTTPPTTTTSTTTTSTTTTTLPPTTNTTTSTTTLPPTTTTTTTSTTTLPPTTTTSTTSTTTEFVPNCQCYELYRTEPAPGDPFLGLTTFQYISCDTGQLSTINIGDEFGLPSGTSICAQIGTVTRVGGDPGFIQESTENCCGEGGSVLIPSSISSVSTPELNCGSTLNTPVWILTSNQFGYVSEGDIVYEDPQGISVFIGSGLYYTILVGDGSECTAIIDQFGVVSGPIAFC